MTKTARRMYESTVKHGEPSTISYYQKVIDNTLAECCPDRLPEFYPFANCSTPLSLAMWALAIDKFKCKHLACDGGKMKFKYDPMVIKRYMKERHLSAAKFAHLCKVSAPTIYGATKGKASGESAAKIINYINLNPVKKLEPIDAMRECKLIVEPIKPVLTETKPEPAIDPAAAGETMRWLREMIDGGRVTDIQIHLQVRA